MEWVLHTFSSFPKKYLLFKKGLNRKWSLTLSASPAPLLSPPRPPRPPPREWFCPISKTKIINLKMGNGISNQMNRFHEKTMQNRRMKKVRFQCFLSSFCLALWRNVNESNGRGNSKATFQVWFSTAAKLDIHVPDKWKPCKTSIKNKCRGYFYTFYLNFYWKHF